MDADGILDALEDADADGEIAGDIDYDRVLGASETWTETDPRDSDTDGDGIADGAEDANRNGVVDLFETDPRVPNRTSPMGVEAKFSGNTIFLADPQHSFNQPQIVFGWSSFLTDNPSHWGVRWKFDQTPVSPVTDSDAFIYKTTTTLQRTCPNAGTWYFHVVPVTSSGLVDTNWLTHVRVKYNPAAPLVSSTTHPNSSTWYPNPIVNLRWTPGHGDTGSVARAYYVWDSTATTVPGTNDTASTAYELGLFEPANGIHYFHIRLQDHAGFLSDTAHFEVRIGEGSGIAPVAGFAADVTNGVAPLTVHFTDSSTGDITTWAWDFNNDGTIDDTSPNPGPMVYGAPGSYTVKLTVSGSAGSDTEVKFGYIAVTPPPPLADFTGTPTNGYPPLEVTFTEQTSGGITNRLWDFDGDGVNDATNPVAPIRYTYNQAGTYSVGMTVLGAGGSGTKTRTNYVRVNVIPPPVVSFAGGPLSGYVPLRVTFTNLSTGNFTNLLWDYNGDGVFDETNLATTVQFTYHEPGLLTPTLTAVGPGGSTTLRRTNYVTANAIPPPVVSFAGGPLSGYVPLRVTFTNLSTGNFTNLLWDYNGDGVFDETNLATTVQFTYHQPGWLTPTLTAIGPGGSATLRRTNYISADPLPPPPVADFSGTLRSGPAPLQVTFTDLSSGDITNRQWDFDNDGGMNVTNPAAPIRFTYSRGGTYSVKLTVSGPGGSDTEIKTGYVQVQNGLPVVEVAAQQIYLNNLGEMATLDASRSVDPDEDALFYSWRENYQNPHHGLIPIGSDSLAKLNLYFPSPGRYQFEVRVSDGKDVSAETRIVTVYVPGRKGYVGFSPSDAVVRVADAKLHVHNSQTDALNSINPVDVTVSDSLGKYYLENVEPQNSTTARTYWYRVERPGFVSSEVLSMTVRPDPGFTDDRQDEPLGRGTVSSLSGSIRTITGTPIQGAYATLIPGVGTVMFSDDTDTNGTFQISNVPKGTWIMQLRSEGYQPEVRDINISDGMPALQFRMTPSSEVGNLSGRVYLAGANRSLANARVLLGTGAESHSDTAGNYQFTGIPTGDYVLLATLNGYEPLRLITVRVRAGANSLDLPMSFTKSGPTVFGDVTDATSGKPVRLATVGVESTGGLQIRSDVTDYTGYYQMADVPTGPQSFRVTAPGYQSFSFPENVPGSLKVDIELARAQNWREPQGVVVGGPVARVAQPFIYLASMRQSAVLDATPSTGGNLRYLWRENPDNPVLKLLPAGSETMNQIQLSGFSKPGIYVFELQVKSGTTVSPNTTAITVFAPGLSGNVHASPSDGVFGLNLATVRAYDNYTDANNYADNARLLASAQTEENPLGNFAFDSLSPGTYWVVARAQAGAGFNQYGPVKRRVNYSSAARKSRINMPRDEFSFTGTINDATTGTPLENVRVVVAPGSLSESFRTTTDATGAFRLSFVPRGSGQLVMYVKEGYKMRVSPIDINGNTAQIMTLSNTPSGQFASVSGRITADYQGILLPVGNAEVIIGAGLARTLTDGSGYYQLNNLPPGDCYGVIRKDGYIPKKLADFDWITLSSGMNTVNKTLTFDDHGPVVRGVVINEYRDPIPGVTVRVLPPPGGFAPPVGPGERENGPKAGPKSDGPEPGPGPGHPQTDAAGIFQAGDVAHGDQLFEITLPDGRQYTQTLHLEGNRELVWAVTYDTYSLWQIRTFTTGGAGNPAVSGPAANPDNDNLPNLFEYVMGYNAQSPDNALGAQWVRRDGTNVRLGFRRAEGVSGVTYAVDTCTNLVNPVWTTYPVSPVVTGTIGAGLEAVEALVPTPGTPVRLFLRLRLTN